MSLLPRIPSPLRETSANTLEWPRLREAVAGYAVSPLGRTWVLALEPSTDQPWIDEQQQRTAEIRRLIAAGVGFEFYGLFDPTVLLDKSRIQGAALEAEEIRDVLVVVDRVAAWRSLVATPPEAMRDEWPAIEAFCEPLAVQDFSNLLRSLHGKIEPDGSLSDDASPNLRRIRREMERQQRQIEESLRHALRKMSEGGSTQEDLITIRGERFVIPVKAEWKRRVPGVVHGASSSGQTVYVEPLETIEQNNELVRLLEEEQSEIHRILVAMTREIGQYAPAIAAGTQILAEIESHFARARFAIEYDCVKPAFPIDPTQNAGAPRLASEMWALVPKANPGANVDAGVSTNPGAPSFAASSQRVGVDPSNPLSLKSARHPLLEMRLRASGGSVVPLTLALPENAKQLIISGPNTGGKTVALKTLGLLALMAQAGIPVPAEEAHLPIFDSVYADIGDAQSIERNLSTFSAHIVNLNRIAREADNDSLVLLDELGSATDPEEGAALAVAVSEHFLRRQAWSFISTHLTALKVYAANHDGVVNAAVGFNEETLAPTYELRLGVPGASAGINIAQRLGLDETIIAEARSHLNTQTADIARFIDQLHAQLKAAAEERESLRRREQEVAREKHRLEHEGRNEQKAKVRELEAKLQSLLKDFDYQIRETVRAIDDRAAAQKLSKEAERRMARLRREFSEQFNSVVVAHHTGADQGDAHAQPHVVRHVSVGDTVKLRAAGTLGGKTGKVQRQIDEKTYEVAIGPMKMRISRDDIAEVVVSVHAQQAVAVTPLEAARRSKGISISTSRDADDMTSEINLIGRNVDEATSEVEKFIDRAFLAGLPRIRIVHGTGLGILRRALREYLRHHPHVAMVTEPPHNEGGAGATVVELRQ
ncbi:MAG: endonuclease MutS2 [Acidobacteriaceae bacterium]